ncbi:MAG: phosphoesterase [Flavobacteriales bacterium]|nr:phosphoesterase [Flavobacteriales bacterium]|tara:strand:+ start:17262 stop:18110 length:849 start_codon:yes stop_codon:yes gene_type:complete
MNRRKFISTSVKATMGVGLLSGLYAWQIEPFWLEFVKINMPLKNLPSNLKGKTIMQISDLHIGNRFDYNYIIDALEEAKNYKPDIVVYTGDYVSYENSQQVTQLREVMKHCTKGTLGTYGILGNHDYGKNWAEQNVGDQITQVLEDNGIKILKNNSVDIGGLTIIGMDDYWGPNFNAKKALSHFHADNANIVLCHNPDVCDLNIWGEYNSWILSGHTHGGQVKAPFLDPFVLPVKNKRYTQGLISLSQNRTLYINRAIGHLWQVRFNVRPEITLFHLSNAKD